MRVLRMKPLRRDTSGSQRTSPILARNTLGEHTFGIHQNTPVAKNRRHHAARTHIHPCMPTRYSLRNSVCKRRGNIGQHSKCKKKKMYTFTLQCCSQANEVETKVLVSKKTRKVGVPLSLVSSNHKKRGHYKTIFKR